MCVAAVVVAGLSLSTTAVSKTTTALPPGNLDAAILGHARMLAGYGEPRLALTALRENGFTHSLSTARLSAGLMALLGDPAQAESLWVLLPDPPDREQRFREQLVRARLLLQADQVDACLATIAGMDSSISSPYAAYRDLVAARAFMRKGAPEQAVGVLERSRATAPDAIRADLDEARVDAYRAQDNLRAALVAAEQASGEGDATFARRMLYARYEIATDIGDVPRAMAAARELFTNHRRSREAVACAAAVARRNDRSKLDTPFLLLCASVLQAGGERDALRGVLRSLDDRRLTAEDGEQERLLWADYHFMGGDYSRAIALARPSYTDDGLRRRSILIMARSYKRVGRSADAATMYEVFARAFPNDALAAEALYTASSIYDQINRRQDRDRVLDQLRHAYPSTFHGWAASMVRAKEFEAAGDGEDASAIFEQWLTRSRRTDEAALFYSARQRRSAGDVSGSNGFLDELRGLNPYSFYACPDLLSCARAGSAAMPKTALRAWMSGAVARRNRAFEQVRTQIGDEVDGTPMSSQATATLDRARFFLEAGFRDWAESELDVAQRQSAGDAARSLDLAHMFDEYAMPWRSVRLYERSRAAIPWAKRGESADAFRYLTHPVPYPVQVVSAAGRENIAPYLLYGMMREESLFDHEIVSRAGAVGLMQLMPETARAVAKHVDLEPEAGDRLGDPIVNVSIGAWYAADLLRDGKGSVVWMLAAYNAGPSAASQWIRPGVQGDAAIDAVESIEYKETRRYVKRVVESANVYHALYFSEEAASSMPR